MWTRGRARMARRSTKLRASRGQAARGLAALGLAALGPALGPAACDLAMARDATRVGSSTSAAPGASPTGEHGFGPTAEDRVPPPAAAPAGMVWIPGGEFSMGAAEVTVMHGGAPPRGMRGMRDARPIHRVRVQGFWIDRTEVTNAEFARFVAATGYVTVAERVPTRAEFPDAPDSLLVPGSLVFTQPDGPVPLHDHRRWWRWQPGAS